jgi:hypothetical protein
VPDLDPNWKRVAQLTRLLGSSGGERRNAFAALERTMQTEGLTWTDLGNAIECSIDGKYTEDEMQQFALAIRKEGVEEGIKIGMARASNGGSSNDARRRHHPQSWPLTVKNVMTSSMIGSASSSMTCMSAEKRGDLR